MDELKSKLASDFPNVALQWSTFRDQVRVDVPNDQVFDVLKCLKQSAGFDMLVDITAVDMLEYPNATDRFEVIYVLVSIESSLRIIVRTKLNEPELRLPSAMSIWRGADWLEREVFDMFGIRFDGHYNLKRLLMPEQFTAFPLRKDYPVKGRGERHNFPVISRAES